MGEDVIASLDSAIDQAQKLCGATKLCLVGFSSGGGCAALIAARRGDVVFLGSVAGNLPEVLLKERTFAGRVHPVIAIRTINKKI